MARDDTGREGGGRGRRRRKRRGRGGRGGEGRGQAPFPQQHAAEPQPFEHGDGGPERPSEFAPGGNGDFAPGEHAPIEARSQQDHGDNGDGERRRRRRGRRGGRRNRRDREGQNFDVAGASGQEFRGESRGPEPYDRPLHNDASPWTERVEQPAADFAHAPAAEPAPHLNAPQPVVAQPTPPPAPAEPPRRRSTVREPAPIFGGSPAVATPMPAPQPAMAPEPVVTAPEPEDANKPRRTGWWAKRLLGGDKG